MGKQQREIVAQKANNSLPEHGRKECLPGWEAADGSKMRVERQKEKRQ